MAEEVEKKAEDHARWIAEYTYFVYKQAFIHGHKHGKEDEVKDALEP